MSILKIENIVMKYGGESDVIRKFSYEFHSGNTYLLLGENGAGKSTLVKGMSGILPISSGEITYTSGETFHNTVTQLQEFNCFPTLKVKEVINLFKACIENFSEEKELRELFNIKKIQNKKIKTLSGGQKKALSTYLSFINDKKIMILDEPFAGLDLEKKEAFNNFFSKYKQRNDKIIILISHEFKGYGGMFDKILLLHNGMLKKEYQFSEVDVAIQDVMKLKGELSYV